MSDATLNRFLAYGTNAQRLAFTPSPPSPASGPSPLYVWYETDTQTWWEFDTAWHTLGTLSGAFTLTGAISPTSLGADQNNYNPSGLASASILRLTASLAVNITGLVAPSLGGQVLLVANIGASAITLKTESASSTAANRFDLTADLALAASQACLLFYDATSARWRLAGGVGGGGGGSGTVTSVGLTSSNLTITGSPVTTSGTLTADIPVNGVGNSLLRQSGALAVVGRSANSTGNVADIQATAASGAVLRESGSTIGFGQITTAAISDVTSGTFTPGIAFGGLTTGITYTEQLGRYIKVGKQVTAWIEMTISSYGSATGAMTVTGLPFTSANPSANWGYAISVGLVQGAVFLPSGWVVPNGTTITLWKPSVQNQMTKADIALPGAEINITAVYESA